MRHAALKFLDLLDPSPDARFNIETYFDGDKQQESYGLIQHFPTKSHKEVESLIPTLQSLNAKGAAIYIAVNQFKGQRKLENLHKVRGIHADLDSASDEQLTRLRQVLAPTIVVQSSKGNKQHWYWLLADGEELSAEKAKSINQSITAFGCDKGATDLARLLRLPGFYNLKPKNQITGDRKATSTPPMVTILEHRQRYSSEEILAAFPTVQAAEKIPLKKRLSPTPTKPINPSSLIEKAASYYETHEPILWSGRWQDYSDPLTGQKPFESQSSADYALCRRIGYWALENGVPTAELPCFVEDVFSASGLANRDKWQQRYDYRDRTIAELKW